MTLAPWHLRAAALCLVPYAVWLAAGCGQQPASVAPEGTERKVAAQEPVEMLVEQLRRATEASGSRDASDRHLRALIIGDVGWTDVSGCRDALRQADRHLEGDPEGRKQIQNGSARLLALRDRLGLEPDEVEEVTAAAFRPLDAYHVELCLRLREVAEQMHLHGLPALQQAEQAFAWVVRQVALRAERDDGLLPPGAVLQRGEGSAHERALLFLAFLHQLDLDGCMIACPTDDGSPRYWIPGALVGEGAKTEIYLFDTRLGVPLPGPDGVATLRQLQQQPELLAPLRLGKKHDYDVTAAQVKAAQVHLVAPLSAVAPRLAYLEDVLEKRDRLRLAVDPANLLKRLAMASGGEVGVWNRRAAPGQPPPSSPMRALRQYLRPEDGGVDRGGRRQWEVNQELWPRAIVAFHYQQLVAPPNKEVAGRLQLLSARLFDGYVLVPHDRLTRGLLDGPTRKLARIERITDEFRASAPTRAELRRQALEWRDRLSQAYLAKVQHGAAGEKELERLWSEDQYLLHLVDLSEPDEDEQPKLERKLERKTLSDIVLDATSELLADDAVYLLGLCTQEMAVRLEIERARQAGNAAQKDALRKAWENAEDWWGKYADRYPFGPEVVQARLKPVLAQWHGGGVDRDSALGLWTQLFRDFRRAITARLGQAKAKARAGALAEARELLRPLAGEVEALRQNAELQAAVKQCLQQAEQMPAVQQARLRSWLQQLARELEPDGSLAWLAARARYQHHLLENK
jgi:hypothetical protein